MADLEEFDRIAQRAIEACRRAGDIPGEIEARHVGTNGLWAVGRLTEFIEINEQLLAQARSIGDLAHVAHILVRLTPAEGMRGNQPAAERHLSEAEGMAATLGLRNIGLGAMMQRSGRFFLMGEVAAAVRAHREFLSAAEDAGAVQYVVSALRFLARALIYEDNPEEAAMALDRALDLSEISGERWNRSELFGLRARAALQIGDIEAAEGYVNSALSSLRDSDFTATAEAYNHLGLIGEAQGRKAEAEASQRRALEALAQTEYNWMKTEPALALAKLLIERGALDEASGLLEEREEWLRNQKISLWDRTLDSLHGLIADKADA